MRKYFLSAAEGIAVGLTVVPRVMAAPEEPVAHAMTWGVLFFMATPYTVLGSLVLGFYLFGRHAAREKG